MGKRGLEAPLFFLALALAAHASTTGTAIWWTAALAAVASASLARPARVPGPSAIFWAVLLLAAWMATGNRWLNPSYSAAAPYHAAFLLAGFLFARRIADWRNAGVLFVALICFATALAAWALWQRATGEARGHALFDTPATFAAATNLVLLPALALYLLSRPRALLAVALVVLFAGMAAAASRGGWIGTVAGVLALVLLARRSGAPLQAARIRTVLVLAALGWGLAWILPVLAAATTGAAVVPQIPMTGSEAAQSGAARLGMYALAVREIFASNWFLGEGYLAFFHVMEAGRDRIATYGEGTTYFVHNDYLQFLLEMGLPGLAGLAAIVILPLLAAWRTACADDERRARIAAAAAAVASMAVHALFDYPFYVPFCLLLYGMALGVIDSERDRAGAVQRGPLYRGVRAACVTVFALMLALPLAAESAAAYAQRRWQAGDAASAAVWFEGARRIDPPDWRYHWYAGQFWYAQAARGGKAEAAEFADRSFAAGMEANPREVKNVLGRIAVHRQLGGLLGSPADDRTLLAWADRAVALSPFAREPQQERERVRQHLARKGSRLLR